MAALPSTDVLSGMHLFRNLSAEELSRLASLLRCKTFRAGTNIIMIEQPGEAAYMIQQGTVKIQVEQLDGSVVILAILGPGEVVGEMSLVDTLGRSANVITMEASTLYWMDRVNFWNCLRAMPTMMYNLTQVLSRRLRLANEQIQSLATLDVYGRVARLILAFAREYGETSANGDIVIPLRLTQSDLAGLVGATRVRVNQVLMVFKRRKYISMNPTSHMIVHDVKALTLRCQ